jgi:histidine ammonia-lyase
MTQDQTFNFGVDHLTPGLAMDMALGKVRGILTPQAVSRIKKSCERVSVMANSDVAVYGVNTGFGPLCTTRISAKDTQQLQINILKSHSCGVGELVAPIVGKLMLILKAHALAFGFSGVHEKTVERIVWHMETWLPLPTFFYPFLDSGLFIKMVCLCLLNWYCRKWDLNPSNWVPRKGWR